MWSEKLKSGHNYLARKVSLWKGDISPVVISIIINVKTILKGWEAEQRGVQELDGEQEIISIDAHSHICLPTWNLPTLNLSPWIFPLGIFPPGIPHPQNLHLPAHTLCLLWYHKLSAKTSTLLALLLFEGSQDHLCSRTNDNRTLFWKYTFFLFLICITDLFEAMSDIAILFPRSLITCKCWDFVVRAGDFPIRVFQRPSKGETRLQNFAV